VANPAVTEEEGRKLAESYGLRFMQTSAKAGTNVDEAFAELASMILEAKERRETEGAEGKSTDIAGDGQKPKDGCPC
jgi:hypothetical protein